MSGILIGYNLPTLPRPIPRAVITIDPGEVSGVALARTDGTLFAAQGTWMETLVAVERWMDAYASENPLVVSEGFSITAQTARNTPQPWSLEAIGVCRYLTARRGLDFETQTAASAKGFASNKRLKEVGWYVPTEGGHLNDAARHLMVALARRHWYVPGRD